MSPIWTPQYNVISQRKPATLDSLIAAGEDNQDTKVYHLVKKLSDKLKPPPSNLT